MSYSDSPRCPTLKPAAARYFHWCNPEPFVGGRDPFTRIESDEGKPIDVDTARAGTIGVDDAGGRGLAAGVDTDCGRGVPGTVEGRAAREALSLWRLLIGNFVLDQRSRQLNLVTMRPKCGVVGKRIQMNQGTGIRNKVIKF